MNDILSLKGSFVQKPNDSRPGPPKLPKGSIVSISDINNLINYLNEMNRFWKSQNIINGGLVSVYYCRIIAKSNRIKGFLAVGSQSPNSTIVGAKFSNDKSKHIITHYIPLSAITESIITATEAIKILKNEFSGSVGDEVFNDSKSFRKINFENYTISKTKFQQIVSDTAYVEKFDVERADFNSNRSSIVTLYETGIEAKVLLERIGIPLYNDRVLNRTTILLDEQYLQVLLQRAPYLVAMAVENISALAPSDFMEAFSNEESLIPSPKNEPTIGVIDTLFDDRVYFHEWVEFHKMIDPNIPIESSDYKHGTSVSSIIVDGPSLNPNLDDGCGRFKVRHFGVATNRAFNSFSIIRAINNIVTSNRDIRVWNLSLGSNEEIRENFISAEAAILDRIQFENDVIFVIAGTNKKISDEEKRIGAPADSINSVVVNSVDNEQNSASFSRKGIVLSFFTKPDVSYYGGGNGEYLNVCEPLGQARVCGTSYAAPWIARKLSYLIDIIGLSKEVAKALLIDSSIGWNSEPDFDQLAILGHGVVPIKINDILQSPSEEIRFIVEGVSEKYDTYNYSFPVPIYKNKHPFVAKATLCYFPKCARNQGVDYTNTELDIYFGRLDNKGKLKSINKNKQSIQDEEHYLYEVSARKMFRKWDNVKHISEPITSRTQAKKVYDNPLWGMSIKTKERLNTNDGEGIRFGVIVTLREINGVNRIDDFIQQCNLKGWLVNRINVENRIDIYQTADEEITFE